MKINGSYGTYYSNFVNICSIALKKKYSIDGQENILGGLGGPKMTIAIKTSKKKYRCKERGKRSNKISSQNRHSQKCGEANDLCQPI